MFGFLSALVGLPRTVASHRPAYDIDEFARVAGGRACRVVVHGNPFREHGYKDAEFVAAVIAAMQGQNSGPVTRFTASPSPDANPAYRVALLFNGAATVRADDLCAASATLPSVEPLGEKGRVRVLVAWCKEDAVLSEVSGWVGGVSAPTDRRFTRLVAQAVRDLFPQVTEPGGLKGH